MDVKRQLLKHFLAAIAYRTQKALREAPESFADFRAQPGVRTPHELIFHMTGVIGYARTFFIVGKCRPERMPALQLEIERFHKLLDSFAKHLDQGTPFQDTTPERMLQGPLSDAMSHAGQLAMLRRLSGNPVPPENFIMADINEKNLTPNQPQPVSPDKIWKDAENED